MLVVLILHDSVGNTTKKEHGYDSNNNITGQDKRNTGQVDVSIGNRYWYVQIRNGQCRHLISPECRLTEVPIGLPNKFLQIQAKKIMYLKHLAGTSDYRPSGKAYCQTMQLFEDNNLVLFRLSLTNLLDQWRLTTVPEP